MVLLAGAGLLARRDQPDHLAQLAEQGIEQIDVVVVNLYAFAQTVREPDTSLDQALEKIDIGGVALLRAAAKNFPGVAAVSSPTQYASVLRDIKTLGTKLGRNQPLALALWETGVYEARMLVSFVGDPAQLTPAQMDRWCKDFDNWAFCDAMSFNLFDRSPHAWAKVTEWSGRDKEFEKRTAFALLWSLSVHDKAAGTNVVRAR